MDPIVQYILLSGVGSWLWRHMFHWPVGEDAPYNARLWLIFAMVIVYSVRLIYWAVVMYENDLTLFHGIFTIFYTLCSAVTMMAAIRKTASMNAVEWIGLTIFILGVLVEHIAEQQRL